MLRHQAGLVEFTKSRLPSTLLLRIIFYDKYKVFAFEKYLKPGSGRAFSKTHFQ